MRCRDIDNQIATNTWSPDEPSLLLLKGDRLSLIGEEIKYAELADWVRQLHTVGTDLSTHVAE